MFTTHQPILTLQLHNYDFSGLVIQVVSALLRGSWQDFNLHNASPGPSAIAVLLVFIVMFAKLVANYNNVCC